jgi:multicomponent Na+:H+ antiporter subunit D
MQLFGAGMMTEGSLAGSAFYMSQSMVATSAAFLCCGLLERTTGTDRIDALGGMYKRTPAAALLFLLTVLCLAGMPPLAGFFGKLVILREGFTGPPSMQWWLVSVIGLVSGVFLLIALFRMWTAVFWGPESERVAEPSKSRSLGNMTLATVATTLLVAIFTAMGVLVEFPMRISSSAGSAAADGRVYIEAVLPGIEWPSLVQDDGEAMDPPLVSATNERPVDGTEGGTP